MKKWFVLAMILFIFRPMFGQGILTEKTGWTSTDVMIYLAVGLVGLFLFVWIADWIWNVSKNTRLLKAQAQLLSEIAKAQGVSKETVETIIGEANKKSSLF